jgi:hypothetical protein
MKMDRSYAVHVSEQNSNTHAQQCWTGADLMERWSTITALRELVYGPEATSGRLLRISEIVRKIPS